MTRIKLINRYRDFAPGSVVEFFDGIANELVRRKQAVLVGETTSFGTGPERAVKAQPEKRKRAKSRKVK